MYKAHVRLFPVIAHLRQRKRFINLPCLRVCLVSRGHDRWKWLIMRIGGDELECRRLPMGRMCQEIPDRPSFRGECYLLLLLTQMVDDSRKTSVIFLKRIQNTLLCWIFYSQTTYSSLCY